MKKLKFKDSPFEEIKFIDNNGDERWYARDIAALIGYDEWRNFENVLSKAIIAAKTVDIDDNYHFVDVNKMVSLGSGSERKIKDFALTRYACYLVIQNADPSKPLVSMGQTYFAIQTRRQELSDKMPELSENEKRLKLRNEMKFHNKKLILYVLPLFVICSCTTIHRYNNESYRATNENDIEVFSVSQPTKPFVEIAEIILEDSESIKKLKKVAAKLGADAIIITGSASIDGFGYMLGCGLIVASSESSGKKAIAIKYK
jgi:peroxiredoxin